MSRSWIRSLVFIVVCALVISGVPQDTVRHALRQTQIGQAAATSDDLLLGSTHCAGLTDCANAMDGNDATYATTLIGGGCAPAYYPNYIYTAAAGVILSIRVKGYAAPGTFSIYLFQGGTAVQISPQEFVSGEFDTGVIASVNQVGVSVDDQIGIGMTLGAADCAAVWTVRLYSIELHTNAAGDAGTSLPYTFGKPSSAAFSPDPVNLATGSFTSHADDLILPGRVLGFGFTRWYNSADDSPGPLGPAWTHSYNWHLTDNTSTVQVRRGDGRRDTFTRNQDGTYATPPDLFDVLAKNGDGTFTLTLTSQVQYEFNATGQLTRIHEPAGNQITLAYTSGNLLGITDTVGRQLVLSYDDANRLTQLQDPLGRKATYTYDISGRLATVTDKIGNAPGQNPALHRWTYGYDGTTRHLATITDPDGRVRVTNVYDAQGRVYQQRDGRNALTQMNYGSSQTTVTDARGHASVYTFDARARVLSQADQVGANTYTISYVYDAVGNRTAVTDRNGKTTDFTYDTRGNLLTKTDPQVDPQTPRYLTQFAYDAENNLTQVTDPRGFLTTMTYNAATSVLLSVSRQIDATTFAVTKYEYADPANPGLATKVIAPRGNTGPMPNYSYATGLTYDAQGNLGQRIDPDGAKTTFAYDGASRLTSFIDPDGYSAGAIPTEHAWTIAYDENDRETSRTDPLANQISYGYDGTGDRTTVTDRRGNVTTYTHDGNTRLATVQQKPDPVGQPSLIYTTTVTRDDNGNATRVTQANGVLTDYGFDALNRLTSVTTHPDAQTNLITGYVLDGNGQPTSRTTGNSVTTTYAYDALSRVTSVAAPGLTTIAYAYDAQGQRTQMTDGTGVTTYQYDGLGRVTQVAAPNGTLTYAYDLDGNRTAVGYPGSQNATYAYSPGGRMTTVTDWASRVSTYTYKDSGLVATLQYPNSMQATYSYDRAQRLTALVNATAGATVSSHSYRLDSEGNRIGVEELVGGITAASVQVNDDTGSAVQDHPAIAIGADGATYLMWDDARSGNADIEFSRRDPATGLWGANVKVNTDSGTRLQQNPAIALDSSNNAYAVWQDERNGVGKPDIYYSKRSAGAGTWSTPNTKVNDDAGGGGGAIQRSPRIAGTPIGGQTAVWVDLRSNQNNIYSSQLPAGSSTWVANKRVTDNTSASKSSPDVAVKSDGTAHAVWIDERSGAPEVYYASLAPGAPAWSANMKISDSSGGLGHAESRIGMDAAGNLIAAYRQDSPPLAPCAPQEIRAVRRPNGGAWGASVKVAASPSAFGPALSVRADGYAWLTWYTGFGCGNTAFDIWGSRYDPTSNTWSVPVRLDDDPGSSAQVNPAVAFTSSATMVAWQDNRAGNPDVRARGVEDHFAVAYDGLNRLSSITGPVSESFSLDAASNIASRTGPPATNSYDGANRQTSDGARTFVWDGADRLSSRGVDTFAYDPLSRLTSATVAGSTRAFGYDGDGLLASRPDGALLWDASSAPAALLVAGTDRIVYGVGPLYTVRGDGSTLTLARDGLGSVRGEVSGTGALTRSFRYTAYGTLAQSSGGSPTLLGYAGELGDSSQLTYLRARWYDGVTGRLLTADSAQGKADRPASLNRYSYAAANPVAFVDPSGRACSGYLVAGTIAYGLWFGGSAATTSGVGIGVCHDESSGRTTFGAFKYGGMFSKSDDEQHTVGIYGGVGYGVWWSPNAQNFDQIAGPFRTKMVDLPAVSWSYGRGAGNIDFYTVTVGPALGVAYTEINTYTEILLEIDLPANLPALKGY